MKWVFIILGIIFAVYLGNVIGVHAVCSETPSLYKAKKYAFYIPCLAFLCVLYCVLYCVFKSGANEEKELQLTLRKFLKLPHKCIVISHFFAEVVAEEKSKHPQKKLKNFDVFDGVKELFQSRKYSANI